MFADPITFNVDGGPQAHTRVGAGNGVGTFVWTDPGTGLPGRTVTIKQTSNKSRFRREIRVSRSVVAADPINAMNAEVGTSVYLVIDEPKYGFSDTTLTNMVKDLAAFLTANTAVNVTKVLTGEF